MSTDAFAKRTQQAARPRRMSSLRLWGVLVFFTIFGLYNGWKVFSLQILQYNTLAPMAEGRIKWKDTLPPNRGLIYDTNGQLLAGNTMADDVYIDKTHAKTEDLHKIADLVAPVLNQQPGDLFNNLQSASGTNVRVAARITSDQSARIRDLVDKYPDVLEYKVTLDPQPLRSYPGDTFSAALLGFVDHENQGHYGVEEYYNAQLAGEAGWIIAEHDANGRPLVLQQPEMQAPKDGDDLVLTIDSAIQYLAERELQASVKEFQADSGYVVVQDPNTGAILAMADYPTYNPNLFRTYTDYSIFKNPVVSDVREPGSTMKILTYSGAVDAGAVVSSTTFYANSCVVKYGSQLCNATFTTWGWESMLQGLGRSDNIAAMYAAEQLGPDRYYQYLKAFGIGKRTGIDLAGEVAGLVRWPGDDGYSPVDFYTTSFGQSAAASPIELITAVSAVANGGTLYKPYVMKQITQDGTVIEQSTPAAVRTVIKPETSSTIADMLAYGVEHQMVARYGAVPGYHVSVKTGTANIISDQGGYGDGTFASAMGFAPSHGAKFTLYIGLMRPKTSQWGENTASMSWGRLAKQILMYMKVQPTEPLPTPTPAP